MAARNISGSANHGDSDSSDEELARITSSSGTKPKPPRINYGDRMPFRQGRWLS